MQTYIVRINDPSVRDVLKQKFEKVGKPRAINKTIIVETNKPRSEIENINGVTRVQEDVKIEFAEYQEHKVDNWALPRICGDDLNEENDWDYNRSGKYVYNRTGRNVDIYIVDTGMMLAHNDFKDENGCPRVKTIYPDIDEVDEDDISGKDYAKSHGTAVGSCAGGNKCGVAKKCNLFNVWTIGSGSSSIKGLDRVLEHHLNKNNNNPSILNMSFGSKNSDTYLYDETKDLVENGVICVACAHNYGEDKSTTPAIHDHVVSVGSTDPDNTMSSFSNYGETVDFLAPGGYVKVARVKSEDNYSPYSNGTSFSSPYTAGILALIVQDSVIKNEKDVNKAIDILYEHSKKDMIEVKGDTPNKFSYSLVENNPIKPRKFKLTTEIKGEGSVDVSETEVYEENKVDIKVEPKEGYKLKKVQGEGTMSNKIFTTDPITDDTNLVFVFEPIKYKVTVEIEGEGTVEPMEIKVNHGQKAEFKYEPKEGYKLKEVKNG